jgi:hypothetical protein
VAGDDAALSHGAGVLSKLKDSMVQAYSQKTGKSVDEVLAIMSAETWVNAAEAISGGWANRITAPKRQLRAVARSKQMPQGVFESLFGDGSDAGQKREPDKERSMSESTKPVAASLAEIKAAFPKAKAEFILTCIERQLPMASVMTDALAAMDEELNTLRAKVAKFEEEAAAKAMETEEEVVPPVTEEDKEEVEAKAKAKAKSGVRPVAKSASGSVPKQSATAQWTGSVSAKVSSGLSRAQAIHAVEREFPGLREQMIEEANA